MPPTLPPWMHRQTSCSATRGGSRSESAVDAVFAAGLLPHLPDAASGLAELARIVRPGGRLALFHPIGRATLAARHGRPLRDDETLDPRVLPELLRCAGWTRPRIADGPDRYLAIADRASDGPIGSDW